MGERFSKIDDKCKKIYAEYDVCYKKWKEETDMRQWYHEGTSKECDRILADFNFCCKEQIARMTNAKPPENIQKVRDTVLNEQLNNVKSDPPTSNDATTDSDSISQQTT